MKTISKYRIYFPITYGRLEKWLGKMSRNGAQLIRYGAIKYVFSLGEAKERSYFVYHIGAAPRRDEGFFSMSLRYPLLQQDIGLSKNRSHLNRNAGSGNAAKAILEVDTERALTQYQELVSERNRLYLLEFLRNGAILALVILLLMIVN